LPVKEPADRDRMVGGQGSALKRTDIAQEPGLIHQTANAPKMAMQTKSPDVIDRHLAGNMPFFGKAPCPPRSTAPYQRASSISSPVGPLPRRVRPKAQEMVGLKSRPVRLKPESRNEPWQRTFEL
jgi:hypothetical protein